jgi:RIO1 family
VEDVEKLIHFKDSTENILNFGHRQAERKDPFYKHRSNSPGWLWGFRGQLMIISSPQLCGVHYATSVRQLADLVHQLERLHNAGYVHGDIRAFNVIFEEEKAHLIDFDFGGKEGDGSTTYPEGYQHCLLDGRRLGREGEPITAQNDWNDLVSIISFLHKIIPPAFGSQPNASIGYLELEARYTEYEISEHLRTFYFDTGSQTKIQELKDLLLKVTNWKVELFFRLKKDLIERGLYASPARRGAATGIPCEAPCILAPAEGGSSAVSACISST